MKVKALKGLTTPGERKKVAAFLCQTVDASNQQKGDMPDRWRRLEAMADQLPTDGGSGLDENAQPRTFPLISPKIDQLVGAISGPTLQTLPHFVAKAYGKAKAKAKVSENCVQFALSNSKFDQWFREGVRTSACAEPAAYKCSFDEGDRRYGVVGPCVSVIHPVDFVLYPLYAGGIAQARVVGERYMTRTKDIRRKGKTGEYYEEATLVKGGDIDPNHEVDPYSGLQASANPYSSITEADDMAVECYELIAYMDLDGDDEEEPYLFRVAYKQSILLDAQPYGCLQVDTIAQAEKFVPYSRPWYFEAQLHGSTRKDYYRRTPFAHKMQTLQLVFDRLINMMVDGAELRASPVGFTEGTLTDKMVKYEAGAVYNIPGMQKIDWLNIPFDFRDMPQLIALVQELADSASRVSQAGTGQQFNGSPTATEVQGVLEGQQLGMDEYRDNATQGPAQMCDFMRELMFLHFQSMKAAHDDAFPANSPDEISQPVTFEPNGKSAGNTPQVQVQKIQLVMQMLVPMLVELGLPQIEALKTALKLGRAMLQALDLNVDVDDVIPQEWVDELGQVGGGVGADAIPGMGLIPGLLGGAGGGMPGGDGETRPELATAGGVPGAG